MSKCYSVTITQAERELYESRPTPGHQVAGGRCVACDSQLEDKNLERNQGYASNEDTGLCFKCISFVNTQANINAALKAGATVYVTPTVFINPPLANLQEIL